jgi:hypothetical protein
MPLPGSAGLDEPGVVVSALEGRTLVLVRDGETLRAWSDAGGSWRDEDGIETPGRAGTAIAVTNRRLVLWGGFVRDHGFAAGGVLISLEP